jgi:inner membrane protein
MDIVTHALLGASAAHLSAARRLPRSAWAIGALAGYAPDLDVLIRPASDPLGGLLWHRHFTHALIMAPVQAALIAGLLILIFRSLRPAWASVYLAATVAMLTHGPLDALTSYGTLLFWPFSDARVALDALPIIDPIITLALAVGLFAAVRTARRSAASLASTNQTGTPTPRVGRRSVVLALAVLMVYTGVGFAQRDRAERALRTLAQQRGHEPARLRTMPQPLSLLVWRGVYEFTDPSGARSIHADLLRLPIPGSVTAWRGRSVPVFTRADLLAPEPGRPAPNELTIRTFDRFNWFADGWLARTEGDPLLIADMRYATRPNEAIALWGLRLPEATSDRPAFGSAMTIRLRGGELLAVLLGRDERLTPLSP